jgi:uncharacterized protein YukE
LAGLEGRGSQLDSALDEAIATTSDLRARADGNGESYGENLARFSQNTARAADTLDKLADNLAKAQLEVERIDSNLADGVERLKKSRLDDLGLELRKQSARLRAGMEIAKQDPSQFGDLPNWRKSRPYFQGGRPHSGTSIDQTPPPAPAERAGVPGGLQR